MIQPHLHSKTLDITHLNGDGYRYGFNGMEKDDEVSGEGNNYTSHFRQYDCRIARWFSLDPKAYKYPEISPYVSFLNNPIYYTDPRGDDPPEATKTHQVSKGEDLSKIANLHNVTVNDLIAWNSDITEENKNLIHADDMINVSDPDRWSHVYSPATEFAASEISFYDKENPEESWAIYQDREGTSYWVDENAITMEEWEKMAPHIVYEKNKQSGLTVATMGSEILDRITSKTLKLGNGIAGKQAKKKTKKAILNKLEESIQKMRDTEYDPDNLPDNLPLAPEDKKLKR